jgi:NAD(P)-dependent dehydrogenase (short-subunit alcohol dehydrogenase family)
VEAFRGIPGCSVYSAFKAGVSQFTRSLAVEVGGQGVRVNALAPDVTETLQAPYDRWVPEEQRGLVPSWVPLVRFGEPADVARVALFLASDEARFVTGHTIPVDGGTLAASGWYKKVGARRWTNRPQNP